VVALVATDFAFKLWLSRMMLGFGMAYDRSFNIGMLKFCVWFRSAALAFHFGFCTDSYHVAMILMSSQFCSPMAVIVLRTWGPQSTGSLSFVIFFLGGFFSTYFSCPLGLPRRTVVFLGTEHASTLSATVFTNPHPPLL